MVDFKIIKYFTLTLVLGMAVVGLNDLKHWATQNTKILFSPRVNYDRARALMQNMDFIIKSPRDIYYIWGASSIEGFFDPIKFDQYLGKSGESYNLGFRSMGPHHQALLAERFQKEMARVGKRAKVSFVRLETLFLTQKHESQEAREEADLRFYHAVYDDELIRRHMGDRPFKMLRLLGEKFFWKSTSPYAISEYIQSLYFLLTDTAKIHYFQIWIDPLFNDPEGWSPSKKGLYNWNFPLSQEKFREALRNLGQKSSFDYSLIYFEKCCGLRKMVPSEPLLKNFLEGLKTIRSFSDKVVVFYYPELNYKNFQEPEAQSNLQKMKDFLKNNNIEVKDFSQSVVWEPDDYVDIIHLSPKGLDKLYRALTEF